MRYTLYTIIFSLWCLGCEQPYNKSSIDSEKSENQKPTQSSERLKQIDTVVVNFWDEFIMVAKKHDFKRLKNLSEPNIKGCGTTITIDNFIKKCFLEVFTDSLFLKISDKSKILYPEINSFPEKRVQVYMIDSGPDGPWVLTFNFIKTNSGYKFHACDSYGGPTCCR